MQQAGITTSGDLAFGSLGVDMELKLAQDFSKSSAGLIWVVPVVYGEIFKGKYGDKVVEEAFKEIR